MDHFCSLAHPFSSLPVYQLGKYALGLYPEKPGWSSFRFAPVAGFLQELAFARGRVRTGRGTIWASWVKDDEKGGYVVELEVPLGLEAVVAWPSDPRGRDPLYNGDEEQPKVKYTSGEKVTIVVRY